MRGDGGAETPGPWLPSSGASRSGGTRRPECLRRGEVSTARAGAVKRRKETGRRPPPRADAAGPPRGGQGAVVRGVGGDGGRGAGKGHRPRGGRIVPLPAGGSMEALSCAQPHGDDPQSAATARTAERLDVRPRRDAPGPGPLGRTGGDVTAGRHGTGSRNGYPIFRLRVPPVPPARVAVPAVGAPQGLPRVREGRGARRRPLARREARDVPRQARGPLRPVDDRPGAAVVPHLRQRERGAAEVFRPPALHDSPRRSARRCAD
jgi:hypothetical protein